MSGYLREASLIDIVRALLIWVRSLVRRILQHLFVKFIMTDEVFTSRTRDILRLHQFYDQLYNHFAKFTTKLIYYYVAL